MLLFGSKSSVSRSLIAGQPDFALMPCVLSAVEAALRNSSFFAVSVLLKAAITSGALAAETTESLGGGFAHG